ncbi:MAG: DEAD/DEAH box helicase [Verrucomicrobiota bacterium]|nr:DEAD/DEAH box helicase [Verrucomicrobiota bacterium]
MKRHMSLEEPMQKLPFSELGLSEEVLKAVAKMGFEEASPIQTKAIPVLLAGSDVVGLSQTGSGKTAAFAIPAIEFVDTALRAPQVLILCPTRELAVQVAEEVAKLAIFKRGVKELPIYGGQSYDRQLRGLEQGAQIIIGTPGRIMDHLRRRTLRLEEIKMVILDEADRMLDMGFVDDIREILSQAPKERQTVFFSATLPKAIQDLIRTFTNKPVNISIEAQSLTVPMIDQVYYEVERRNKVDVLCRIIDGEDLKYGIIFCATKMMVDDLVEHLSARGYAADKMHGDMTQIMRERVIAKFKKRGLEFLVATDVAARGLDVDNMEVVINFDLPHDGEDYVHRIGRTGRAGKSGRAMTLVAGREIYKIEQIIRYTKGRIRRVKVPSTEEVEEKRTNIFFELLKKTLEEGKYKRHDALIDSLLDQGHSPTDIASALVFILNGGEKAAPAPERQERPEGKFGNDKRDKSQNRAPQERAGNRNAYSSDGAVSNEEGMIRLRLNVGRKHRISPGDILGMIVGMSKINKSGVGAIRLQDLVTLVDVKAQDVDRVIAKIDGINFKGNTLKVELSRG